MNKKQKIFSFAILLILSLINVYIIGFLPSLILYVFGFCFIYLYDMIMNYLGK